VDRPLPPSSRRCRAAVAHGGAGDPAALPALALVLGLVAVPLDLLGAWHSRRREWAADRYAVGLADPEAFARGFERLVAANLAELEPPRLERVRASHPSPAARIAAARRAARRDRDGTGRRPRPTSLQPAAGAGDPAQ
jgi:Zn-dependent protease with chaperone function